MIFKLRLAHWRLTFTIAPVIDVVGVNSKLKDGKHIVMWDFDDVPLRQVAAALSIVQHLYDLPNIYILSTLKKDHYIAYSFARLEWRDSVEVVASTRFIDPNFFKYGVYREKWTLRVTKNETGKPKLVRTLASPKHDEVSISELNSWVQDAKQRMNPSPHPSIRCTTTSAKRNLLTLLELKASAYNMRRSLMLPL
jgi:hypothetical protein